MKAQISKINESSRKFTIVSLGVMVFCFLLFPAWEIFLYWVLSILSLRVFSGFLGVSLYNQRNLVFFEQHKVPNDFIDRLYTSFDSMIEQPFNISMGLAAVTYSHTTYLPMETALLASAAIAFCLQWYVVAHSNPRWFFDKGRLLVYLCPILSIVNVLVLLGFWLLLYFIYS